MQSSQIVLKLALFELLKLGAWLLWWTGVLV